MGKYFESKQNATWTRWLFCKSPADASRKKAENLQQSGIKLVKMHFARKLCSLTESVGTVFYLTDVF